MHAAEWLEAWRAGAIVHDWTEIELTHGSHVARVKVSADSARVRAPGGERIREGAGGFAADQVLQALRGHLLTAKLIEARHLAATVILQPILAPWIERGGNTEKTTPAEASDAIDYAIETAEPFTGWGDSPMQAKSGDWLVSNTGKPFCLDERCTDEWGVNHGWLVHESGVVWKQDRGDGKPGHIWVRGGAPCWPAVWAPGWYVLQRRGRAHRIGAKRDQDDYASPVLGIFELCWLDGQADVLTEKLFTVRELCGLVTHDERPFASVRHPGVPLVAGLDLPEDPMPDTDRSPVSLSEPVPTWRDPELTQAERKVAWCAAHLGITERPDGSNNGPEIRPMLEACVRDGQPGFGAWLGKAGGNWCTAFASTAARESHLPELDAARIHKDRASGYEIEQDLKKAKRWRAVELVMRGEFVPEPGDYVSFPRGEPGSWRRHGATLERYDAASKMVHTFDGNKGNTSGRHTAPLHRVLGFGELHDPRYSDEEIADMLAGVVDDELELVLPEIVIRAADPGDDGDNLLEHAWSKIEPSPWALEELHGVVGSGRRWRVLAGGIHVGAAATKPRRTKGKPVTVSKIIELYGQEIANAAEITGVSLKLILGMLATEAGTNRKAERFEKHLNDYSFGLAQTLTATAHAMAQRLDVQQPAKSVPRGGDADEWREFLFEPANSVLIGAAYLDYNDERFGLLEDPVLAYAAYNAGSPRVNLGKPWGVHYFTFDRDKDGVPEYDALDTFAAWYGDACAVLG